MNYAVALIGETGLLGKEIKLELESFGYSVTGFTSKVLDISNPQAVEAALSRQKWDMVINAAAYTKVDLCETHQELAFAVNGDGPKFISEWCFANKTPLIHFSTDYVFDGSNSHPYKENDAVNPLSVYGKSKLQGEQAVLNSRCDAYIFRIQWLFGDGPNFIRSILKKAAEVSELRVVNDQHGSPTWTKDLAKSIRSVLEHKPPFGIYHLASEGYTTWYDLAKTILSAKSMDTQVHPVPSTEYVLPAKRPQNSRLNLSKFNQTGCLQPPFWEDAVRRYCDSLNV